VLSNESQESVGGVGSEMFPSVRMQAAKGLIRMSYREGNRKSTSDGAGIGVRGIW